MFGIGKALFNPVSLFQLAMGPAGWASLATKLIGGAIANTVIQKLGEQLGLPQGIIDIAKQSFAAASGTQGGPQTIQEAVKQLGEMFGLSPTDQGNLERAANNDADSIIKGQREAFKEGEEQAKAGGKDGKARSWLQIIADSMAKVLDGKVKDMDEMAKALDKQGKDKSIKTSTDLQVAGQEFSYLMNASSTVIKTIGEGLSGMARKQ